MLYFLFKREKHIFNWTKFIYKLVVILDYNFIQYLLIGDEF